MKSLITLMVTLLTLVSGAARADISCTYWQTRNDVESAECFTFTNKYSMPVVIAHNSVESGQISLIRFSGNFDTLGVGQSMTVVSRVNFENGFSTNYKYYAQAPDASEWSSTLAGMCTARDIQSGDKRDFTFDLITGVISMMECNRLDLAFRGQISTSILSAENRSYRPNSGSPPATESVQDAFERRISQHLTQANITIRESGRLVGEKQKRLDELSEAVRKYLDMDVRQIDMNALPADMPAWFKSLIAEVKRDIESQTAQLKENESKKLAIDEAIQTNIKAIFQSEDGVLPEAEIARGVEESLNAFEESVESSDADVYFQVRTSTYLSSLESSYKSQERLEFLRQVYAWQEESKVLLDTFIALQSEDVDAYNAFVQSQNAIKAYVDQMIDSEYYFRDLNLDGDIKGSIELLAGSEPVLAQRLKSSLNALTPAQLAANRGSVESIAPAIDGYLANQGGSSQKIFQSILEKSIYVLRAIKDVVTCIAKQQAAGILGSFSEMVTRKDFCTGEELDAGGYTMSVIGFLGDAAELSGLPQFQAGGVLLGLGIGFKKLFDVIMPALRKIGSKEEIRGVFDLILDLAASRKSEGVKDFVSKVTKLLDSARKWNIPQAGIKSYAKIHDAVESLPTNLIPTRIRPGTNPDKIAIIGRSMGNRKQGLVGVSDAATHFESKNVKVATFTDESAWKKFQDRVTDYKAETGNSKLPASEVVKTDMYKSNKNWAENLKAEGYTVVDLGDPNELYEFSAFYAIEKFILFEGGG